MTVDWQIVVVVVCAIFAAGVLIRRGYQLLSGSAGGSCGSGACSHCPSNSESNSPGLVQLQPPGRSAEFKR